MRIVIDMQGAQTESRFRGIGRYTMGFAMGVARNRGEHEVILVLNGLFPDTIEPIREAFDGLLPQENIRVWYAPGPVEEQHPGNDTRREVAELIREAFIASLNPDIVHVTSLFEGYVDDAVTSISRFDTEALVSVTLYDLIPLLNPEQYLQSNPSYQAYYQQKIEWLKNASLLFAISDYAKQEALQHLSINEDNVVSVSTAIEEYFHKQNITSEKASSLLNRLLIKSPYVFYTGGVDERKNLSHLIEAYSKLPGEIRTNHQLVFAGKMPEAEVARLQSLAKRYGLKQDELIFTGYISDEDLIALYNLCKLFVFPSWHEGFGLPALEAMACGAIVIGSNTSSLPEVIGLEEALFDPFNVVSITEKMQFALTDAQFRQRFIKHAQNQVKKFSWDITAKISIKTWQEKLNLNFKRTQKNIVDHEKNLIERLARYKNERESYLCQLSASISQTFIPCELKKQLLVDVSELVNRDSKTGVQRVVRNILREWLINPPDGYRVEPVYATTEYSYRYARQFTAGFMGLNASLIDEPIDAWSGDTFIALDLQHHILKANQSYLQDLRNRGVIVKTVVYDLLPVLLPDVFEDGAKSMHQAWLETTAKFDGVLCISKSVADEYQAWLQEQNQPVRKRFSIDWFHLGADIESSIASTGLPKNAQSIIKQIQSNPSFLMVGTIEPRKGHAQTLEAFEFLWQQGVDINLVLVGKQGWLVDELVAKLRAHTELNKRLFWLEGISDELLEQIYSVSTCLIAASYGEGFGLPLIEAAQKKKPIIACDIPVFKEVAGEHAYYFEDNKDPQVISQVVTDWLHLYKNNQHPKSDDMPWLSWKESAQMLLNKFLFTKKYKSIKNYEHAVFAINEPFFINLYAYFSKIENVVFIVPNTKSLSVQVKAFIAANKLEVLSVDEVIGLKKKININKLWVHSFGLVDVSKKIIASFNVSICFYTDYLKNAFFIDHFDNSFEEILFFGFIWNSALLQGNHKIRLCSFQSILHVYENLSAFYSHDLAVNIDLSHDYYFLRYWGKGNYKFKEDFDYAKAVQEYIKYHPRNCDVAVIKGDARISKDSVKSLWHVLHVSGKKFLNISELVKTERGEEYVNSLPAEVLISSPITGMVHAFDSTFSIYLALLGTEKICFPSLEYLESVFADKTAINTVVVYSGLYKTVIDEILTDLNKYRMDGSFIIEACANSNNRFKVSKRFDVINDVMKLSDIYML